MKGEPDTFIRRHNDGNLFRPGHPPEWNDGDAIADMLKPGVRFYFIGIEYVKCPWWQFWRPRWRDTKEIWRLDVDRIPCGLFDVVSRRDMRRVLAEKEQNVD